MEKGDDSKKYFKIQVGSRDVDGATILVDPSKSPEKCLKDLTSSYKIDYIDGDEPHYLLFKKSDDLTKEKPTLKVIVEREGDLRILEAKERIFKTRIDKIQVDEILKKLKN